MATWECRECGAAYAPGAPQCPQCGTNDPIKEAEQLERERDEMAKVSVHHGASNAFTGEGMPEPVPAEADEQQADGVEATDNEQHEVSSDVEGDGEEVVDYNAFTVEELRAELADRDLPVSGKKDELVTRLAEDDGKKLAAETGQESAE